MCAPQALWSLVRCCGLLCNMSRVSSAQKSPPDDGRQLCAPRLTLAELWTSVHTSLESGRFAGALSSMKEAMSREKWILIHEGRDLQYVKARAILNTVVFNLDMLNTTSTEDDVSRLCAFMLGLLNTFLICGTRSPRIKTLLLVTKGLCLRCVVQQMMKRHPNHSPATMQDAEEVFLSALEQSGSLPAYRPEKSLAYFTYTRYLLDVDGDLRRAFNLVGRWRRSFRDGAWEDFNTLVRQTDDKDDLRYAFRLWATMAVTQREVLRRWQSVKEVNLRIERQRTSDLPRSWTVNYSLDLEEQHLIPSTQGMMEARRNALEERVAGEGQLEDEEVSGVD